MQIKFSALNVDFKSEFRPSTFKKSFVRGRQIWVPHYYWTFYTDSRGGRTVARLTNSSSVFYNSHNNDDNSNSQKDADAVW